MNSTHLYTFLTSRTSCLYIIFIAIATLQLHAQDSANDVQGPIPEKIYLQLDGEVYTTDQIIWYKAIVTNTVTHAPSLTSGILYVELIDANELIIEKKLIKITKGIGSGFFQLDKNFSEGRYLIRAYTEWNKNFDLDLMFRSYINVFPAVAQAKEGLIQETALIEEQQGVFKLRAKLQLPFSEGPKQRKLRVYLTIDGKKDTLILKKNKEDNFLLEYPLTEKAQMATLTMETENSERYTKTIALDEERIDIQFFPESGELVHGLTNKVGCKILDYSGKGISEDIDIVDENDQLVTSFKSNPLGMGIFFIRANSDKTYFAKITSFKNQGADRRYPLPKVVDNGSILSVAETKGKIRLIAASNHRQTDSVFIKASCRGVPYYFIEGQLKQGDLITAMPKEALPEGIIMFTMMDQHKNPIAERLFFNEHEKDRLQIQLAADKDGYKPREKTTMDIQVFDKENRAVRSNLSILALNRPQMGSIQDLRHNILTYFLLGSELKGTIEDPGYYFDADNAQRSYDLEALMLTQGWRRYKYRNTTAPQYNYRPEAGLNVSGKVAAALSANRIRQGIDLKMLTFGTASSFYSQTTDSLGKFDFQLDDEYGDMMKILIQSSNKAGKKKTYNIALNQRKTPDIQFDQLKSIEKLDRIQYALAEKHQDRNKVDEIYESTYGVTQLKEVVVEGQKLTPQRKIVQETYGEADVVIPGNEIQEKEKKWSYGLYSILLFNYSKEITIEQFPDGFMLAHINGGGTTLVVIDGIPVPDFSYALIPSIPPSEIKSVELIKYADNFLKLYMKVFPDFDIRNLPKFGSVIAVYTHAGKGLSGAVKPKGLLRTTIPIFSVQKEFYAPKYDTPEQRMSKRPDLRALVHWDPELEVDATGHTTTSFYNADNQAEIQVVVEAISENGEIGYQELIYEVKEQE